MTHAAGEEGPFLGPRTDETGYLRGMLTEASAPHCAQSEHTTDMQQFAPRGHWSGIPGVYQV